MWISGHRYILARREKGWSVWNLWQWEQLVRRRGRENMGVQGKDVVLCGLLAGGEVVDEVKGEVKQQSLLQRI